MADPAAASPPRSLSGSGQDPDGDWFRRLLDVGRALTTELDQRRVLDRVLETAREITGARFAAVGILNEQRTELAQFLTSGIDEQTHRAIGDLPRGRGVLGALIADPRPLRLADVGGHPSSYGFPLGHPVMRSFLGVPVVIRGRVWGNLYLAEKAEGEFTEADEEAAVILSQWAAIAIETARLYEASERRRLESEKFARGLEATRDVAVAIGGEIDLEHVLELIAKRGRALVG
ncbi:MAG: GAF domain-containing protein, partial [Solirubrobacteraceae bacterium]